jgi:hypothetical protein
LFQISVSERTAATELVAFANPADEIKPASKAKKIFDFFLMYFLFFLASEISITKI